jgi:hypothetical protein
MKLVVVTQWVRALGLKSHLINASPAGQERTPRAHPVMGVRSWRERGSRPRDRAPKYVESWSGGSPQRDRGKRRRGAVTGRQQSWRRYGEYTGHHRGLRAGHASTGVTRELGRAKGLLGDKSGAGVPPSVGKTPGVERKRPPFTRALGDQGTQSKRRDPKGSGKERENRTTPRWAIGSLSGA